MNHIDLQFHDDLSKRLMVADLLSANELQRAEALGKGQGLSLDRALLKLGMIEEDLLLPQLAEILGLAFVTDSALVALDQSRVETLTHAFCSAQIIAPILDAQGRPLVLTPAPGTKGLARELAFHLDTNVTLGVASTRTIRALLATEAQDTPTDLSHERIQADRDAVERADADGPVIRFVSEVFDNAVARGASDIHFGAQESGLRIRFRLSGVLQSQLVDRSLNMAAVLARVKVMAGMNVSERRLPQDGRITSNIAGRKVDFRVSSIPTSFGESITCRVLDPKALRLGWDKLGFDSETAVKVVEIIEQPSGLFLVTGPTGSGKTTTLYTALAHLNNEGRKIITIEDPIEYNLAGVEQVQVHEEVGMTFARALRSFLRQDPNVIMVGEIRDEETAEIACRSALVGRMVLSTLHTSSPEGAVTRLVDLGVPEYIVRDVLRGVLGQELVVENGGRRLMSRLIE
ncbi:GspE/PulE family protein [uncultured Tateyamaria sp.]|uniref:GspE/PulE family protein n=1 Tax=uncultured Tateyamaria sp. TaxID=455651 RepID=UPI0026120E82|nr:GspE/PulE family protein [uncultured Tateyamaria sp.]